MTLIKQLEKLLVVLTGNNWSFPGKVTATSFEVTGTKYTAGQRFFVEFGPFAPGSFTDNIWIAPYACKIVAAQESHQVAASGADVINLEKLEPAAALGAGSLLLGTGFSMNSTANTPLEKAAVTTAAATFAKGNRMAPKLTTGDGSGYGGGKIVVEMEWV